MKEIYDWVPWFRELARKIAENKLQYLAEKSKEVDWKEGEQHAPLLDHGDDLIDPFSFLCTLAGKNTTRNRKIVYPSIKSVFELDHSFSYDDVTYFPVPDSRNVLFHYGRDNSNPELLWRLFYDSVKGLDNIPPDVFENTLAIKGVGIAKLTQVLFLINPKEFFPLTGRVIDSVNWVDRSCNLDRYKAYLNKVKDEFPGCMFYEIDRFLYIQWKNPMINQNSRCFLVNAKTDDRWKDFNRNNHVYMDVVEEFEQISHSMPKRGDIILVFSEQDIAKGVGIVEENDYQESFDSNHRIHVVWINKQSVELPRRLKTTGFGNNEADIGLFKDVEEFKRTFEQIAEMMGQDEGSENGLLHDRNLPLNQILFGPPGTGKTYKTKELSLRIIGKHQGDNNVDNQTFEELRYNSKMGNGQIAVITFHQNYAYEDFIEGIKPDVSAEGHLTYTIKSGIFKNIADSARKNRGKRFVLIIDEINRGNIAKVFGELITLIEDSRRLNREDETIVTLPYSGEDFGVPSNLYIIGTMNTADRSIQLLDTALRRRFTFKEMMPVYEILPEIEGIKLPELLKYINKRITVLLDREHQIGHTYLMNVKTIENLAEAFQNKIFPLLQEYFFNDWKKIIAVLGNNKFIKSNKDHGLDSDHFDEDLMIYTRLPDNDPAWRNPSEYQRIYQSDNSAEPE